MIFGAFERLVALRYLRARREEGFISLIAVFSLLGIALGVATLIIVMSVMNGFRHELLTRILGVNGHLSVFARVGTITEYEDLTERLLAVPGVATATPQIQSQVMVMGNGSNRGGIVRGLKPEDLKQRQLIAENIKAGSLDDFQGQDHLVMGYKLAQQMGLNVGDSVTLVFPSSDATVLGTTVPRLKSYLIAATFDVGMYEYDSSFVYIPLEAAQVFFRMKGATNAVEVFLDDPEALTKEMRWDIDHAAGGDYRSYDWQQSNSSFFSAIQVERNVMFLILSLIILVAAFNILSGQTMLVKSKGRDIAILRTMGATRGMVMRIFFLSGASIGIIGTVTGFALGLAFSSNIETIRQWLQTLTGTTLFPDEIYFLSQLPAIVDPNEVVQVVLMALFWSFLAPLWPAWRAARLDPVEALRYE